MASKISQMHKEQRKTTDTLYFIKMENFYASKVTIKKVKRQSTEREKIFASRISDRDLHLEREELLQLNTPKTIQCLKQARESE